MSSPLVLFQMVTATIVISSAAKPTATPMYNQKPGKRMKTVKVVAAFCSVESKFFRLQKLRETERQRNS